MLNVSSMLNVQYSTFNVGPHPGRGARRRRSGSKAPGCPEAPPRPCGATLVTVGAHGHDTALFRRLVLSWINADFRVQIRIFHHFSKSTRKSPSREQIWQISAKKLENFAKFLTFFGKFWKILQNFQKSANFWQIFAESSADFYRNL